MRGVYLSFDTGPERCAVTDVEVDAESATTMEVTVVASCPNRPDPMSRRLFGMWLCWDHMQRMEQDRKRGGAMA